MKIADSAFFLATTDNQVKLHLFNSLYNNVEDLLNLLNFLNCIYTTKDNNCQNFHDNHA